jgi:hypothetical protein
VRENLGIERNEPKTEKHLPVDAKAESFMKTLKR